MPRRLLRLARSPRVRRVVVDLRLNGGDNNTSYGSLLAALRSRTINRPGKLRVLTSWITFSAAGNFAAEVDRSTHARLVGEPTGGSPNNYGDALDVELPTLASASSCPPNGSRSFPATRDSPSIPTFPSRSRRPTTSPAGTRCWRPRCDDADDDGGRRARTAAKRRDGPRAQSDRAANDLTFRPGST
jgi:hypothetical protein